MIDCCVIVACRNALWVMAGTFDRHRSISYLYGNLKVEVNSTIVKSADDTKPGRNANRRQQINDIKGLADIRKLVQNPPNNSQKKRRGKKRRYIGLYMSWPSILLIVFQGIVDSRSDWSEIWTCIVIKAAHIQTCDTKQGGNSSHVRLCAITFNSVFNISSHWLTGRSWKKSHNDSKAGKITLGERLRLKPSILLSINLT